MKTWLQKELFLLKVLEFWNAQGLTPRFATSPVLEREDLINTHTWLQAANGEQQHLSNGMVEPSQFSSAAQWEEDHFHCLVILGDMVLTPALDQEMQECFRSKRPPGKPGSIVLQDGKFIPNPVFLERYVPKPDTFLKAVMDFD